MKAHVQAVFTTDHDDTKVEQAQKLVGSVTTLRGGPVDVEKLPDHEFDALVGKLKSELLVEVLQHADGTPGNGKLMLIKSDDAVRAKVRAWVEQQGSRAKTEAASLKHGQVQVIVRGECCALTSSGQVCPH